MYFTIDLRSILLLPPSSFKRLQDLFTAVHSAENAQYEQKEIQEGISKIRVASSDPPHFIVRDVGKNVDPWFLVSAEYSGPLTYNRLVIVIVFIYANMLDSSFRKAGAGVSTWVE